MADASTSPPSRSPKRHKLSDLVPQLEHVVRTLGCASRYDDDDDGTESLARGRLTDLAVELESFVGQPASLVRRVDELAEVNEKLFELLNKSALVVAAYVPSNHVILGDIDGALGALGAFRAARRLEDARRLLAEALRDMREYEAWANRRHQTRPSVETAADEASPFAGLASRLERVTKLRAHVEELALAAQSASGSSVLDGLFFDFDAAQALPPLPPPAAGGMSPSTPAAAPDVARSPAAMAAAPNGAARPTVAATSAATATEGAGEGAGMAAGAPVETAAVGAEGGAGVVCWRGDDVVAGDIAAAGVFAACVCVCGGRSPGGASPRDPGRQ